MIGETVYVYDMNNRVYVDDHGNKTSAPNPRHYYVPCVITGETTRSWVTSCRGREVKINKKDMSGAYTQQQVEDALWVDRNRHAIAQKVERCRDVAILKQIEALLK